MNVKNLNQWERELLRIRGDLDSFCLSAERAAINAPMQGTAADIIKRAMLTVHEWLVQESNGARLVMQVHDELVLEVPVALFAIDHVQKTDAIHRWRGKTE